MTSSGPRGFEVRLHSRRVQRELDQLRQPDYSRVLGAMHALAGEPSPPGCKKLYDNVFRVRVGAWRIVYRIDNDRERIEIGAVRWRTERTYKRLEDLFS